jgi:hypothetical protein
MIRQLSLVILRHLYSLLFVSGRHSPIISIARHNYMIIWHGLVLRDVLWTGDYYSSVTTPAKHLHRGDQLIISGAFGPLYEYACVFALVCTPLS